jgi:hypothetical protein
VWHLLGDREQLVELAVEVERAERPRARQPDLVGLARYLRERGRVCDEDRRRFALACARRQFAAVLKAHGVAPVAQHAAGDVVEDPPDDDRGRLRWRGRRALGGLQGAG